MTWTNAFDAGPCTLTVMGGPTGGAMTQIRSVSLAKGGSDAFTASVDGINAHNYTLAVDAVGRVTLSSDSTYNGGLQFAVDVAPADMTNVTGGRLANVAQYLDTNGFAQGTQHARGDGVDDVALSGGGN